MTKVKLTIVIELTGDYAQSEPEAAVAEFVQEMEYGFSSHTAWVDVKSTEVRDFEIIKDPCE